MDTRDFIREIVPFLHDDNPAARQLSVKKLLPFTSQNASERALLYQGDVIETLAGLCLDIAPIAHDAFRALINLTDSALATVRLANIPGFVPDLLLMLMNKEFLFADFACMLLSNMTKVKKTGKELTLFKVPRSRIPEGLHVPGDAAQVPALDIMLTMFTTGQGRQYNPQAEFDFLASVFADLSTTKEGVVWLLGNPDAPEEAPLAQIIVYTEHPSVIRRGGVMAATKNVSFAKSLHTRIVAPEDVDPHEQIDVLPRLLLPLCGPEEFDFDIFEKLPELVQAVTSDKKREPDAALRCILVETLILLATSYNGRERLRARGVYEVIKVSERAETDEKTKEAVHGLVNLLMREESAESMADEGLDEFEEFSEERVSGTHGDRDGHGDHDGNAGQESHAGQDELNLPQKRALDEEPEEPEEEDAPIVPMGEDDDVEEV